MKRIISLMVAVTLLASAILLVGCSGTKKPAEDGVLTVVCTTFAGYDFARQITRSAARMTVAIS